MTQKEIVLEQLKINKEGLTCSQLSNHIKSLGKGTQYLSGSISSLLNNLVKEGLLNISVKTGIKKGKIFLLK